VVSPPELRCDPKHHLWNGETNDFKGEICRAAAVTARVPSEAHLPLELGQHILH
jgi:hypothetical protein